MRVIEYYDRIHKQKIELEVTDEVALFLQSSYKEWERKQKEYNYRTISLNTVIYSGESEDITLEETIAAPDEEEVMNCRKCKQRLRFYNLVWKVAGKLDKEKYDLIWDLFVLKKSQKKIAIEKGISESALSQLKDTAISDLRYELNYDNEFQQTDFYKKFFRDGLNDFVKYAKEFTLKDIGYYIMNDTYELSKQISQVMKKSTTLGKTVEDKDKISKGNRLVKQTIEALNPEQEKGKSLSIPEGTIKQEDVNNIIEVIRKFFK